MKIPFIGGAYKGRSSDLNPQECINLYPVVDLADGKSVTSLVGSPGLIEAIDMPASTGDAPGRVRALFYRNTELYAVIGEFLYKITAGDVISNEGSVTTLADLLTNGDMELDANWTSVSTTTNERSATQKHGGTYSRHVEVPAAPSTAKGIYSDAFTTISSRYYTVEFWVYPVDYPAIGLWVRHGDDSAFTSAPTFSGLVLNTWNYCKYTFVEEFGGASAYVGFFVFGAAAEFYIDDVRVFSDEDNYGKIWIANNNTHLVTVEPGLGGHTYVFATDTLAAISDGDFPVPRGLCYLDGYFIVTEEGTNKWFISALNDPTSWDALDFSAAESRPGVLKACMALTGQVALLGTSVVEFHAHTGAADWPFSRVAVVEEGLGPEGSLTKDNDVLYFINLKQEVVSINNYRSIKLSTEAIDYQIQSMSFIEDASSFIYTLEGHTVLQISFPTENKTFCYDITTGLWHEKTSYLAIGSDGRHRADCFVLRGETPLVGDYENGKIYEIGLDYYSDNGYSITRRRTSPVLHNEQKDIFYGSFQLDYDKDFATVEHIVNGGMERDSNWLDINEPTTNERWPGAQEGSYSRHFVPSKASSGIRSNYFTTVTGQTYTLTFYFYPATPVTTGAAHVRMGDDSDNIVNEYMTGLTTNVFNLVTIEYTETNGGDYAYVYFTGWNAVSGDFYVDCVSLTGPAALTLDWSNDGGRTYGAEHTKYPVANDNLFRAIWRRLGKSRNRVFRVTTKSPSKVVFIDATIEAEPGVH